MIRSYFGLAAALFVVVGSAGCMEAPASEPAGYVSIALTASGAEGAIYRLPQFTSLVLSNGSFFGSYFLDDEAPVKTVSVPPGNYSVRLFGNKGETTVFPLIRENADSTFDTVPGTLEPAPTITVAEDQTTALAIRFQVPIVGPISFALGSVDVSVVIDETDASSFDVELSVHELTASNVSVGGKAPAELSSRLPALGDTGDSYVVRPRTVGPWSFVASGFVCAPVTVKVDTTGNRGFTELVAEVPSFDGQRLCIQQATPQRAFVSVDFFRFGTAKTPLLSDLGDRQYSLAHGIRAQLDARIFDGTTLHLNALNGLHAASMSVSGSITAINDAPDGQATSEVWYSLIESGDGTIALTPR